MNPVLPFILIVLVNLSQVKGQTPPASDGWISRIDPFERALKYYKTTYPEEVSYSNIQSYMDDLGTFCGGNKVHLATVTSQRENDFILSINNFGESVNKAVSLLGGIRNDAYTPTNGQTEFNWVTDEAFEYTNWYSGQPDNDRDVEDCVEMWVFRNGTWNDGFCNRNWYLSLELDCTATNTTLPSAAPITTSPSVAPTIAAQPEAPTSTTTAPSAVPATDPLMELPTAAQVPVELEIRTEMNQPVKIPPPDLRNQVDFVRVTETPRNGGLNIEADGSVTYTPDTGFLGKDYFAFEVCDIKGQCTLFTVTLQAFVTELQESSNGGGSSTGLYALALLALIPIGIVAFMYRKKMFGKSKEHQQSGEPDVAITAREVSSSHSAQVSNLHFNDTLNNTMGYVPENKDQCRSVANENRPATGNNNPPLANAVFVEEIYEEIPKR